MFAREGSAKRIRRAGAISGGGVLKNSACASRNHAVTVNI
jgi:hypothetical protein